MTEIFILAEHRRGQIRDITFEMLSKGRQLSEATCTDLTVILLGEDVKEFAKRLSAYAKRVLLIEDSKLTNFNSEAYQIVLSNLINKRNPLLTMIGQTSYGVDLAPSLATSLSLPLATDCIDLKFDGERLVIFRQMYNGKVNVRATLQKSASYIVTIRQSAFTIKNPTMNGEITELPLSITSKIAKKRFIEYISPSPSEVDISAADVLVSVGRGIKDLSNMPIVEELAAALGGVIACSRPIVDKGWLLKDRQVGTSGKTVNPKLYIAIGISGAFQHLLGMKTSDLIIAINKDTNAPIFNIADYGIINDLFKIVPALTTQLNKLKK